MGCLSILALFLLCNVAIATDKISAPNADPYESLLAKIRAGQVPDIPQLPEHSGPAWTYPAANPAFDQALRKCKKMKFSPCFFLGILGPVNNFNLHSIIIVNIQIKPKQIHYQN